jgi:hypothetical protein
MNSYIVMCLRVISGVGTKIRIVVLHVINLQKSNGKLHLLILYSRNGSLNAFRVRNLV